MKFKTAPQSEPPDTTAWLDDLPPAAVTLGRTMLDRCVMTDRAAFREYLWAFAALEALPRTRETPLEALADANARACHLLEKTKWRQR